MNNIKSTSEVIELQQSIFEKDMTRKWYLEYEKSTNDEYRMQVFRNHSFELIEHTWNPFLDYAGIAIAVEYAGYDDSFSFVELDKTVDIVLVWIDFSRYGDIEKKQFIEDRINVLMQEYKGRILLVPLGNDFIINSTDCTILYLNDIQKRLGSTFFDERMQQITGTALSRDALFEISKEIGLKYLPSLVRGNIKAIILDLDNTLYKGILGEDGYSGIEFTEGHILLQKKIRDLALKGFMVCFCSKNEGQDVLELFNKREDFLLDQDIITGMEISWDPKSNGIGRLLRYMNISASDVLFIDDNIGELVEVQSAFPDINIIMASDDATKTLEVLNYFPRINQIRQTDENAIRRNDIKANEQRRTLEKESVDKDEYIRKLDIKVVFSINDLRKATRIAELSNKTNQFIFNYGRFAEREIFEMMESENFCVVSANLSDKLSDSGLISAIVAKKNDDYIEIVDCFMSCRALGRGIEKIIIENSIDIIMKQFGSKKVLINFCEGPKNLPAKKFVEDNMSFCLNCVGNWEFETVNDLIEIRIER